MHKHDKLSDSDLLSLLIAGDRAAFESIYHRYAADLFRYARKNILSSDDCEEMIQDVFESLWLRHDSLSIQSLRHYLFNSVRYMIIRHIQHRGVKKRYVEYYKIFASLYESASDNTRDSQALQDLLLKHLETLPARCQIAMSLRLREELTNEEIAQRMNITKGTVELYMCKALNHLRHVFKQTSLAT